MHVVIEVLDFNAQGKLVGSSCQNNTLCQSTITIAHFSNFIPWKLIKLELHKYFFFICPLQLFPRKYFVFVKDSSLFLLDVLEVVL